MLRTLMIIAAITLGAQLASRAEAAPHPIMDRLGHGLSHGLHRLGEGLRNATHHHHRGHHRG